MGSNHDSLRLQLLSHLPPIERLDQNVGHLFDNFWSSWNYQILDHSRIYQLTM